MSQSSATTVVTSAQPTPRRAPRWSVIIVACLCAGLIPETVLTSSTSVLQIIVNPFAVIYLSIFYGTAMLLIREAIIRRHAGWFSVALLGIAFGFCNEGVVAGTWYTVKNQGYLFLGGVDVAWAVGLTVFHLFISMLVTIAFADILFPAWNKQPLLGRRGPTIAAILFLLSNALVIFARSFRTERFIVLGAALVLVIVALRLPPAQHTIPSIAAPPRLWILRLVGFVTYALYFMLLYFTPLVVAGLPGVSLVAAQFIDIVIMASFAALVLGRGVGWLRRNGWGLRHNLALITGVVAFEVLISVLIPTQIALLEPVATVPVFAFLLWRSGQLRHRERAAESASEIPLVWPNAT